MQEVMEYARCKEVSADKLVTGVKEMFESVPMNLNRTVFWLMRQSCLGKSCLKILSCHEEGKSKDSHSEGTSGDWNLWNNEEMFKSGAR